MKKLFNAPEMAITRFDVENIITTSIQSTDTYKNAETALGTAMGNANVDQVGEIFTFTF